MRKKKNVLAVSLMISSLALLLVLQFFWLRGAYLDAEEDFMRETNALFRSTIISMHDSLILKNLERVESDSLDDMLRIKRRFIDRPGHPRSDDSMINYINITERNARIEIFADGRKDSIGRILRPLMNKIQRGQEPKTFMFRLGADSLIVDSIHFQFKKALEEAKINAPFKVVVHKNEPHQRIERKINKPNGTFISEIVHIGPLTAYAVSFTGIEVLVLKEITPQILFSAILTLLTSVAFYMMHRNLRVQERLMEAKNNFISNVTHELKTPVATVSVTLEALKNFNVLNNPDLSQEYLDIAQRELKRLNEITDKILKTSLLEKEIVITKETTALDRIAEDVIKDMKLILKQRGAKVSYQKTGEDFSIHCDAYSLYQMTANLIDNALKYSNDTPYIELDLKASDSGVQLAITDHGVGIGKEYQQKIFDKFFRVPTGDIHTVKGYGLGLSFVYNLVKSLGGDVDVKSEKGKGSTFTVTFPRIKVHKLSFKIGKV